MSKRTEFLFKNLGGLIGKFFLRFVDFIDNGRSK